MPVQTADPLGHGADLLARGDLAGAERIAQARLARSVDPATLHLLALVRARQNRLDEAVDLLARALTLAPGHAAMLFHRGKMLALLKRDAEAAEMLEAASLAQPGFLDALYDLGEARQRLGQNAKAEAAFRQLLALMPRHSLAQLSLGVLLKDTGRTDEGAALLAQGLSETEDRLLKAAFAYNLAFAQYDQGQKEQALENFTQVAALDPKRAGNADIKRAHVMCELQRFAEAEALLKERVAREPHNDDAHAAYNQLLYSQGRDTFLDSYALAPRDPAVQSGKAALLVSAGRLEEAAEVYAAVLAQTPGFPQAVTGSAATLSRLGRHDEALACLEEALRTAPGDAALFTGIASAALRARDPQKAAAMAEKVLAQAPHDQQILAVLGSAWRLMGDDRDEYLNGYDDLIRIFDLEPPKGYSSMAAFNAELDGWLGTLHLSAREPINQSLRSGSQSWGNIFNGGHELVERVRARIEEAMAAYIAGVRPEAGHPFRARRGKSFRFRDSWSSRLSDCGYHINHVHPAGWISSCYYVGVPEAVKDETAQQGWIKFGEPAFDIGLKPRRAIQPAPGRLVLFPSYMWHGTNPFRGATTRTTIAFDAVPHP